jgi:hypothetical protein
MISYYITAAKSILHMLLFLAAADLQGYKLLNPGQTFKIVGIIQEVMCTIVLVQLKMLTWPHKASLPGHTKALLALLNTYQSLLGIMYWRLSAP